MPRPIVVPLFVAGAAVLAVALTAPYVTSRPAQAQADPAAVLRQYHDALNGGDVPGAVAFFTDDGVLEAAGMTFSGQSLRMQHQAQVSQNRRVSIVSTEVSGDTVTARVEVRSNQITACGAERVLATETVTFSGDKIARLVFRDDPSDPQTATLLACTQAQAQQLPATGGAPLLDPGTQLPLSLLAGVAVAAAGALLSGVPLTSRAQRARRRAAAGEGRPRGSNRGGHRTT